MAVAMEQAERALEQALAVLRGARTREEQLKQELAKAQRRWASSRSSLRIAALVLVRVARARRVCGDEEPHRTQPGAAVVRGACGRLSSQQRLITLPSISAPMLRHCART